MSAGDGAELKRSPAPQLPDIQKSMTHNRSSRTAPADSRPAIPAPRAISCAGGRTTVTLSADAYRPRRTCMSVPASSERFLAKARDLAADEVMLDLEDSVAPAAKPAARELAVAALQAGGWAGKLVAVRVNGADHPMGLPGRHRGGRGAPGAVDSLVLPKVSSPAAVVWLDVLLGQVEQAAGLPAGTVGIEAQIEDAAGLAAVEAIAACVAPAGLAGLRPCRLHGLDRDALAHRGRPARGLRVRRAPLPADADAGRRQGPRPAGDRRPVREDRRHGRAARRRPPASPRSASTASGCCTRARSTSSTRRSRRRRPTTRARSASWTPTEQATSVDRRGAVMLDGEMIDEASRKMALAIVGEGRGGGPPEAKLGPAPAVPRVHSTRSWVGNGPA